jgi:excisionase family DNA binding protein
MEQRADSLLTVKQAAAVLGMAPSSLYRLAKSCRVPSYSVGVKGRGVRIDVEEAKAALRRLPAQVEGL